MRLVKERAEIYLLIYRGIVKRLSRESHKLKVAGSNPAPATIWGSDGIGSHNGLKIHCPKGREGSSPSSPTIYTIIAQSGRASHEIRIR